MSAQSRRCGQRPFTGVPVAICFVQIFYRGEPITMRRILIAATICAAACGGKSTIMATAAIKASATQAQSGMSSASTNTQASIGLQGIGSAVGGAAASGNVSSVDLTTGLQDPGQLAAAALAPSSGSVHRSLGLF